MKFLIDECLSPKLVAIARERGHGESTHVTWLGMRSRKPRWSLAGELGLLVSALRKRECQQSIHFLEWA